ncbi:hypothetical protein ACFFLZ_06990 [Photobacterium aphoticum]|nr:hypothetical protein [Photobacterium aphoticum]
MNRSMLKPVKWLTFQLFFHYRHFFQLTYYPILAVCIGATVLNMALMLPFSNVEASPLALVVFMSFSLYWAAVKRYYTHILAWSDPRTNKNTVHVLKRVSE